MSATKLQMSESGHDPDGPEPASRLTPYQVCFVVDDVDEAAAECQERFAWGPFRSFRSTVEDLHYQGRPARRVADVAVGMAGRVQVELLHVHDGVDCLAAYQARHGRGFQHLGIDTPSRDTALARLEGLGARLDHLDEFEGIQIAFVDVPVGPGLFELVDRTTGAPRGGGATLPKPVAASRLSIDRATVVTDRMDVALDFFASAFGWRNVAAESATLRWDTEEAHLSRALGTAGRLEIELVEGRPGGRDPYSRTLARSGPGLVHAGGVVVADDDWPESVAYCWLEAGETFALADWSGGAGALQLRDRD